MPPLSDGGVAGLFQIPSWAPPCSTQCSTGNYWACVGSVSWPTPKSSTTTIHFNAWRYPGQNKPLSGLPIRVCNFGDVTCAAGLTDGTTDPDGVVPLSFPNASLTSAYGVNGYLQIDPGDAGIAPYLYFWGFPLSETDWLRAYFAFESPADLQNGAQLIGQSLDPNKGSVIAVVSDCLGYTSADVSVTLSGEDAGNVVGINPEGAPVTDSTGIVIFLNVSPGLTELTATPSALGKPSSKVSAYVRAGTVTGVLMYPTPL